MNNYLSYNTDQQSRQKTQQQLDDYQKKLFGKTNKNTVKSTDPITFNPTIDNPEFDGTFDYKSFYNTNTQRVFTTNAQKPEEILYQVDVADNPKNKDNYFGLVNLGISKTDILKKAVDGLTRINPMTKVAAGITKTDLGQEAIRGFAGTTVDMAAGLFRGLLSLGAGVVKAEQWALTAGFDKEYTDKQLKKITLKTDQLNKILKDKTDSFMKYTGIEKTDKDGFVYDLFGGGASLLISIAATLLTKSPAATSYLFGQYQYQSLYEESIEKGFSPMQARKIGLSSGAAETLLEFGGLHSLFYFFKASKGFAKIVKTFVTEALQEGGQTGAEELIAKYFDLRDNSVSQILNNIAISALIGGIWGGGAGVISNIVTGATKELIDKGIKPQQAEQLANGAVKAGLSDQAINTLDKAVKDEQSPVTYKNADPRESYKEFGQAVKKALDPQQQRGIELEFLQEKQKFKDFLIENGFSEQEAELESTQADVLARTAYEQEDIKPAQYYKTTYNINFNDDFNPAEFDDEFAQQQEEAALAATSDMDNQSRYEEWLAEQDKANNTLSNEYKFLQEMGINKIRIPEENSQRYTEYKELSPRIKRQFFTDNKFAQGWDEAEQILKEKLHDETVDIFGYLRDVDFKVPQLNQKKVYYQNRIIPTNKADRNNYVFGLTAKDLIKVETIGQLQNKLQNIFGTYEQLDAFEYGEKSDVEEVMYMLSVKYMADLEYAAKTRDYIDVQDILDRLKRDILEIAKLKDYNNTNETVKEKETNDLSAAGREDLLRAKKAAAGNLSSNTTKTDLQIKGLSLQQLKQINENIILHLFSNDIYFVDFNEQTIKFLKDNNIKDVDKNGIFVEGKPKEDYDRIYQDTDKKYYTVEDIQEIIEGYTNLGYTKEVEIYQNILNKFLDLQNKVLTLQDKLRVYIAKNTPKTQQQLQQPTLDVFYQSNNQDPRGATTVDGRQYYIDLFSTRDKSTLIHELTHVYLSEISRFAALPNATKKVLEIKAQLDNWLGKPENDGKYSTPQQEKFATNFEAYVKEGIAPTAKLKAVFEKFKVWMSQIYDGIKNDLPKMDNEAKEFFDNMLSKTYDVPDSSIYDGKVEAIKEVIKNIKQGKVSEVDGIGIEDVYKLLNLAYVRKPNKPSKNLKQLLNDKNIYNFDELEKAGADKVLQMLQEGGYVTKETTANKALEAAKAALDGKAIYRLADGWRVKGDIDFRKNLRTLEKVVKFEEIDGLLEKILELQQEGYRRVEQQDVEQMKDYSKKLFTADVKQAKGYIAEIIEKLHRKSFIDKAAKKQMMTDLQFSSTLEEMQESVLSVIEDLKNEIELVKESLKHSHRPTIRKDKTVLPPKKATKEEKDEYKKYMKTRINRLLKQVLPGKKGNNKVSKFGNIEIERFFEELTRLNGLTVEQAERELMDRFITNNEWIMNDEKGEGFDNIEKIKNMFLGYKAKRITSHSCEFLKELYDSLVKINVLGRNEKQIVDFLKKTEQADNIDKLLENLENNKSKNKVSNWFKKFYNYSLANWYSCINSIAGQDQAETDALELLEKKVFVEAKNVTNRIIERSCKVLGLTRTSQFDTKINEYLKEKYEFIQSYIDHRGREVAEKQTLNKMQLICCYIWSKNKQLNDRIARAYGNEQFKEMMAKLDKQDMLWGDIIQEETASLYDEINSVYVRMYGLDMGQEENYFPSSTERIQGDMDLFKDFIVNTTNPGFIKGRVESSLILMKFDNPVKIAFNHITKATRFYIMQEKLAGIYKKYLNTSVEKELKRIYGDDKIFNYIKKMLDNIRFTNFTKQVDIVNSMLDHFSNAYVLTRIAGKPSIMVKQLLSFSNYMEDVDSALWIKHFAKMMAHPEKLKQVKEFMYKHSPYLKLRYESGAQNEALEKAMEAQAQTILKIKTFKGFLSLMTRIGDIGAIVFGGYPMIQAQLEKGVDIKTAFENFEKATLRSQQANFASTLSNWQNYFKNSPLLRALFAFANTPSQYSRKLVDVCYKMAHGDENFWSGKGFKTLVLYGIEQSFVYTSFTSLALISGLVNGDWDDFKDDVWLSLFQISNFLGVPILGQIYNTLVSMVVTGDYIQDKRVPILDDFTSFLRAAKKAINDGIGDLSIEEWIDTTDKLASITTGIPLKTLYNTWISSWFDILNGDYGKGLVKLYGATEHRADKIFD